MKLCFSFSLLVTPHRQVENFNMLYIDKLHVLFELSQDLALDKGLFPTLSASKHVCLTMPTRVHCLQIYCLLILWGEREENGKVFSTTKLMFLLSINQSICLSIYHLIYPILYPIHLSSIYCFYLLFIDSLTFYCHILNVLNSFKTKNMTIINNSSD